jgi:hypothetical protein
MADILSLQRLPQIESLDLNPCNLALADSCQLCSHTCCCTVKQN